MEIPNIKLNINSIGCPTCRAKYQEALRDFIRPNLDSYCDICKTRFEKNPMRILDFKEEKCKKMNQGAPIILDYLCDECKEHFENVKSLLEKTGVKYEIDPNIVRGLDYYTRTVFEFVSEDDGLTVLGGGRYDGLIKEVGGQDTPAIGFAMGVERLLQIFEKYNADKFEKNNTQLYIATVGDRAEVFATNLVTDLRYGDVIAEMDICGRSLKAQFKYADKIGAMYVITIGDDEVETKTAKIKNMRTGEEKEVSLDPASIITGMFM